MTLLDKGKSLIHASRLDSTKRKNDAPFLSFTNEITVAWTIKMAGDGFVRVIASHRTQIYHSIACLPVSLIRSIRHLMQMK